MTTPAHQTPPDRIAALTAIRDAMPGTNCPTQCRRLLTALQTLGHITTFEGSRHLDIYDVRARKLALVKAGREILTTWRRVETEAGERHRIGVYSLVKGAA